MAEKFALVAQVSKLFWWRLHIINEFNKINDVNYVLVKFIPIQLFKLISERMKNYDKSFKIVWWILFNIYVKYNCCNLILKKKCFKYIYIMLQKLSSNTIITKITIWRPQISNRHYKDQTQAIQINPVLI